MHYFATGYQVAQNLLAWAWDPTAFVHFEKVRARRNRRLASIPVYSPLLRKKPTASQNFVENALRYVTCAGVHFSHTHRFETGKLFDLRPDTIAMRFCKLADELGPCVQMEYECEVSSRSMLLEVMQQG